HARYELVQMLFKGVIHILVCALFVSRLVPKYFHYRETDQVDLFGHALKGGSGLLVLIVIALVALGLLVLSASNFKAWISSRRD
ncbi:MAG: hypothetical protein OXK72_05675, partial [Gammaproteobacteria bacterium]|nr:hypothetical protein [Gammaproteobacteria bacterium]